MDHVGTKGAMTQIPEGATKGRKGQVLLQVYVC
jgi:hypothetical protein